MADPILDKVVQDLADARAKHPEEFSKLSPGDLDAYIKEETQGKYGLHDLTDVSPRNLGRSAFEGLTFNFGDELTGLFGGNENEMRLRDALFKKAHPWVDAAANIVGSAPLLAVPGLGEGAEGESIGAALKAGAKAGALSGALYGAGSGENGAQRFVRGATGATAGGLLGAAIPGAIAGVKAAMNPARVASRRLVNAIEASGGVQKLLDELNLARGTGRGDLTMLADLSPQLAREADFAANNSDAALVDAAGKIRGRQRDQAERLLNDVRDKLGGDPVALKRQQELDDATRDWARQAYGALEQQAPTIDASSIASRLTKPGVADAYTHARLAGDITAGSPLDAMIGKLMAANPGVDESTLRSAASAGILGPAAEQASSARSVTFGDLQQLKRILDDRVTKAYRDGNGELAKSYKTIRDEVKGVLVDAVPDYAKVDAQYAAKKELHKAIDRGIEAWDEEDTRQLSDQIKQMTSDELREFRLAMASELIARLRSAKTNQNMAQRLLHGGAALEDKLRIVFGSPEMFDDFMQRLGVEGNTFGRVRGAIGGSETVRRLASAGFDPAEILGSAVAGGPAAVKAKLLASALKSVNAAKVRNTATIAGQHLFTQGGDAIESLLQSLTHPSPLLSQAQTRAALPLTSLFPTLFSMGSKGP